MVVTNDGSSTGQWRTKMVGIVVILRRNVRRGQEYGKDAPDQAYHRAATKTAPPTGRRRAAVGTMFAVDAAVVGVVMKMAILGVVVSVMTHH